MDKLAGLVPSLQVQGPPYSYPELPYTEMADRTPFSESES